MKTQPITAISLVLPFILWAKLIPFSLAQDDYYLIAQAAFNSVNQQILASLPNTGSIFFRPLGMQAYFYLMVRLFWITAWKYRIIAILVHGINSILVYKISQKIIKQGADLVWLMYLMSPWQFAAIGWIANISYLTGALFAFLSILSALKQKPILSILFFTFGILTNELAVTVPLLIFLLNFLRNRLNFKPTIVRIIPMFVILGLYEIVRLKFPSASTGDYGFGIGFNILQNIRWLLIWTLGWPETYKDQFISLFSFNKSFLLTFPGETLIFAVTSLLVLVVFLKSVKDYRLTLLGISWFITALLPVIFFSRHIFPHYVVIAGVGLYLIVAGAWLRLPRQLKIAFITLWTIQFMAGLKINLATHWWSRHALEAQALILKIKNNYPFLPKDKRLLLEVKDPAQAELVLSGDNAVKLIYNDPGAKLTIRQAVIQK